MSEKQADTRSASQKISDLENAAFSSYENIRGLANDQNIIKDTLKLLNAKINALVQALSTGQSVNDELLDRLMTENSINDLKQKVKNMIDQGIVVPTEQIASDSFVVGSELTSDDQVMNPRRQFALFMVPAQTQASLTGGKVGDVLNLEGGLKFKVLELYKIQPPKQPEAPVQAEAAAEAAPAEAPIAQPDQSVAPAV